MDCLRLAVSMAISKAIVAKDVLPTATEFYRWIDDDPEIRADATVLAAKYMKS
jgi:hypothetical protein